MSKTAKTGTRIARICWNTDGWIRPSGSYGKTQNKDSYEHKYGYGMEEWLFDLSKPIDHWHYGFLQPIQSYRAKHTGESHDIFLYSIDARTKNRWLVGRLNKAFILSKEESRKAHQAYKSRGFLQERAEQLQAVGGSLPQFRRELPYGHFNIKYRADAIESFDPPLKLERAAWPASPRYRLQNAPSVHIETSPTPFAFKPSSPSPSVKSSRIQYDEISKERDLFERKMQLVFYHHLVQRYGQQNVSAEQDTGSGTSIDIVIREGLGEHSSYIFYELKHRYSARIAIRDAIGQLLEYCHYPTACRARKLVIVSSAPLDEEASNYLKHINTTYNIPISYQSFDINAGRL